MLALCCTACHNRRPAEPADDVKVELTTDPDPPQVGCAIMKIKVSDSDGKPIRVATLKLEGNTNQAGMKPVLAEPQETDPGHYETIFPFMKGGDWVILISGTLSDGRKFEKKVELPGVSSP
jgi:hypothetical protein